MCSCSLMLKLCSALTCMAVFSSDRLSTIKPVLDCAMTCITSPTRHSSHKVITQKKTYMHAYLYSLYTRSVLPDKPTISPSCASTTVDVSTSPDPVTSIISISLGSPVDVTCKMKAGQCQYSSSNIYRTSVTQCYVTLQCSVGIASAL